MKKLIVFLGIISLVGCQKTGESTWENMKTAGRYMNRGIDSLCGKEYDSCALASEEDFLGPKEDQFIPLSEKDLKVKYRSDMAVSQPKLQPGEKGSGLPAMHKFSDPSKNIANIFQKMHFETDDHVVRKQDDLINIQKISQYLKKNPNMYLSVQGHCDERASAAYNMALGTRRSNHVRVLLIKNGVDFNRIYTVSHGKEKPIAMGHNSVDWIENRRAEFKVFQR